MNQSVAVITGAGRGIGRATAVELARRYHRVVLAARSADELAETAHLVGGALTVPLDISRPESAEKLIAAAKKAYGRVDVLVHCAGLAPQATVESMTPAQWQQVIDTNLSAAFYLAHAAWPIFKAQQSGVIVNLSSLAARDPFPGFAAYGAAKAALHVFGLVLAREGEPINVRVHTIALGAVDTAMFRALVGATPYPAEKTLAPGDVARMIAHCASGELKHTSGEVIWMHKTV